MLHNSLTHVIRLAEKQKCFKLKERNVPNSAPRTFSTTQPDCVMLVHAESCVTYSLRPAHFSTTQPDCVMLVHAESCVTYSLRRLMARF
jgi:hypothetical protein